MKTTIRYATKKDAALIASLSRETFYHAFASVNTKADMDKFMNEVFTPEKLMAELDLSNNIFLLAYNGTEIAGYVRMRDKTEPEISLGTANVIEIARIYTSVTAIGSGAGSALMNACISIAGNKKRDFIWLGVWEKNEKAIRFYNRFDFERFGQHEFILGDDIQTDILMAKKLR